MLYKLNLQKLILIKYSTKKQTSQESSDKILVL